MKRSALLFALLVSVFFSVASQSQTLKSVALEAAQIKPGDSAKATIITDMSTGGNCALKVHWGDGQFTETKINQEKDATMVLTHAYAKAGKFDIMVEPKRVGAVLKCLGNNQKVSLTVVEPPKPVVAEAAKPVLLSAKNACPAGWKITAAGLNAKTKAFTCTAKVNTPAPEVKTTCPGDLTYFENTKKGQLGCKP
jgi:hypothetical protein